MLHRRTMLQAATASLLPLPALAQPVSAQPALARVLRLVSQAALTILDPVLATAAVSTNHGYGRRTSNQSMGGGRDRGGPSKAVRRDPGHRSRRCASRPAWAFQYPVRLLEQFDWQHCGRRSLSQGRQARLMAPRSFQLH